MFRLLLIVLCLLPTAVQAGRPPTVGQLYGRHCARCHGTDRLGGMGPALLPQTLARLSMKKTYNTIAQGEPETQMPAFAGKLSAAQIRSLVQFIYAPPSRPPHWGEAEIRGAHRVFFHPGDLGNRPVYKADPLNLFVVVELGDHHVTILDGDKLEPIFRFPTHRALHGGPKFSPHGRYVYFASRDGWISKFDLYNLKMIAETRAGINTRNLAVSGDGRYVMVGNGLPRDVAVFDARDLSLIKLVPAMDRARKKSSRVSAVYQAAPRDSFIVALKDLPEVWEISYKNGRFPLRRIDVGEPLDDFMFDQPYRYLIGARRGGGMGRVVDLDRGIVVASIDLPGMPHLGSGITWTYKGRTVMATPNLQQGIVSIIDMKTWKTIRRIKTLGPGFFIRSHENTPYAWTDVFFGPNRDAMQVIDKRTLKIVKTLRPSPGKTSAHVEFDRYGRYALVSIWDMDGAVVVYDARTLKEIKRLPMKKPSGKYNVYNKIHRSAGTSH